MFSQTKQLLFFRLKKAKKKIRLIALFPDLANLSSFDTVDKFESALGAAQKKTSPDLSATFTMKDGKITIYSNICWDVCCINPDQSIGFLRVVLSISESQGTTKIVDRWLQTGELKLVGEEDKLNQINLNSNLQKTEEFLMSLRRVKKTKNKNKVPGAKTETDTVKTESKTPE